MSRNETGRTPIPDPEVVPLVSGRRFTAKYKSRILEEGGACTGPGELGALLRREEIYSSCLSRWWRARKRGQLAALESKKRGPKPTVDPVLKEEITKLRRENERLQGRLAQAEAIMDVPKNSRNCLG
jgi:transposase